MFSGGAFLRSFFRWILLDPFAANFVAIYLDR